MNIKPIIQFYSTILLLTAVFTVSLTSNAQQKSKHISSKKPNIVYILADDMGYGELGCYGQSFKIHR
jgi:glucose uptake protein GlcU